MTELIVYYSPNGFFHVIIHFNGCLQISINLQCYRHTLPKYNNLTIYLFIYHLFAGEFIGALQAHRDALVSGAVTFLPQ